jgi:hypothetical protein
LFVCLAVGRRQSDRLGRREATRCGTRLAHLLLGLVCLGGGSSGHTARSSRAGSEQAECDGSEQCERGNDIADVDLLAHAGLSGAAAELSPALGAPQITALADNSDRGFGHEDAIDLDRCGMTR